MPQKSPQEVLITVVDVLANANRSDRKWKEKAKELAQHYRKGHTVEIEALGKEVSQAIAKLPEQRCNELTVDEIAALLQAGVKTAQRRLAEFVEGVEPSAGPSEGRYHTINKALQGFKRYHYHLKPFQEFLNDWTKRHEQDQVKKGEESWRSPAGLQRRQGKRRNEAQRQADILEDAKNLALRDHPEQLESFEKILALFKKQGLVLVALPQFAAFIHAQVADITTSVVVNQPWLINHEGQVLDHAWWPIDHTTRQIRTVLEDGGTIVEMPLVESVRTDWKGGNAWGVWAHIAGLAAERWQSETLPRLAKMRSEQAEKYRRGMNHKVERQRT